MNSSHINHTCLTHSFLAPEYALDEQLVTASDMYSLGCLVHAVHKKGEPPFKNHGGLSGLRENSSKPVPGLDVLDPDLQGIVLFFLCLVLVTISFFFSTFTFFDYSTLWFTTNTRNTTLSSLFLFIAYFNPEFPGSVEFHC